MGLGQVDNGGIPPEEVKYATVPYFIQIEPAAVVAAGVTQEENYTVSVRDFICTHLGFITTLVGVPPAAQVFDISIEDVGMSRTWQPHRWSTAAVIGNDSGVSTRSAFELPAKWKFEARTTIRVEFENRGTLACLPTLVLVGYLGQMQ